MLDCLIYCRNILNIGCTILIWTFVEENSMNSQFRASDCVSVRVPVRVNGNIRKNIRDISSSVACSNVSYRLNIGKSVDLPDLSYVLIWGRRRGSRSAIWVEYNGEILSWM